jgi:hypothetical protein
MADSAGEGNKIIKLHSSYTRSKFKLQTQRLDIHSFFSQKRYVNSYISSDIFRDTCISIATLKLVSYARANSAPPFEKKLHTFFLSLYMFIILL